MTDIQAKYQKLATEYSKLRAQLPVLKKAVLDEQAAAELLRESLKEKDQAIRKYDQEADSLIFRNNQLSSRVSSLQQELEETQSVGKKHKKSSGHVAPDTYNANANIIDEELRSKIEENARLHKQVYESDQEHRTELTQLQERLVHLETESAHHETLMNSVTIENREKINKLQEEKAMLEIKIQRQEKETKESMQRVIELEEQLNQTKAQMMEQLDKLSSVVQRKVPLDDQSDRQMNALNIPSHNHQHQLQARELISQANTLVQNLVQGFSDYFSRCEERSRLFADVADGGKLSEINKTCCKHLQNHQIVLKPIRQTFEAFHMSIADDSLVMLETAVGLRNFVSGWKNFVIFTQKILPYQQLNLEEESALSSCPSTLASKNMDLHSSLQRLVSALCSVDNYIALLSEQSHNPNLSLISSQARLFEQLSRALNGLHESTKELSRHFNAKVSLEHQLPTATQKLKITDECILSAIISLVTCTSKISAFFSGNLEFFTNSLRASMFHDHNSLPTNPAVTFLRQRATDYLALINRPPAESVPYTVALQNRKTVYSFTESKDTLTQQVVSLQERLGQMEQEREHWMLETQLMQMKFQKESQKVMSLKKIDENLIEMKIDDGQETALRPSQDGVACGVINTSLLGRVDVIDGDRVESEMREDLITKHYTRRVTDAMSQLQLADSKALHFYAECRALQKRLVLCQKEKDGMQDELTKVNQCVAQLKDELQTTSRSYEGQLSMMSEHLAGMNERLTSQKDEIDLLKYQLQQNTKDGKKSKKGR